MTGNKGSNTEKGKISRVSINIRRQTPFFATDVTRGKCNWESDFIVLSCAGLPTQISLSPITLSAGKKLKSCNSPQALI